MKVFNDFNDWKAAAKKAGFNVRLITRSKHNLYYQAWEKGTIIGYFNTGPDINGGGPYGELGWSPRVGETET